MLSDAEWLWRQYLSPLNGMRDIAEFMVNEWGYSCADYPGLLDELEAATWEAFSDAARDVMREHGLRGPADAAAETEAGLRGRWRRAESRNGARVRPRAAGAADA